jgi:hypothetical protein
MDPWVEISYAKRKTGLIEWCMNLSDMLDLTEDTLAKSGGRMKIGWCVKLESVVRRQTAFPSVHSRSQDSSHSLRGSIYGSEKAGDGMSGEELIRILHSAKE